jgi:hypothetical protein
MLSALGNILVGILSSCIAALALGPFLTTPWSYRFVVVASKCLWWTSSSVLVGDEWTLTWHVTSENFDSVNPSPLKLHRFFNVVAGEWTVKSKFGASLTYRLVGQITNGTRLTGRWFDIDGGLNGYAGALQLIMSHLKDSATGMWIGYSSTNTIKGDAISLRKIAPAA